MQPIVFKEQPRVTFLENFANYWINSIIVTDFKTMKRFFFLPQFTTISLTLLLTAGVIVISDMGCAPKPACGSNHDHKVRKRKTHHMAPSMAKWFWFDATISITCRKPKMR